MSSYTYDEAKKRDTWGIKAILGKKGLKQKDIARMADTLPSAVSETIWGRKNNRRTLAVLRDDVGVPVKMLALPEDMLKSTEG